MRFIFILILFPIVGFSQTDNDLRYTGVVEVPGENKEALFIKARQYVATLFNDAKEALQISDLQTGELAGSGNFDATYYFKNFGNDAPRLSNYQFRFGIYVKDGKFKYEFFDIVVSKNSTTALGGVKMTKDTKCPRKIPMINQDKTERMWRTMQEGVESRMLALAEDLKKHMLQSKPKTDF